MSEMGEAEGNGRGEEICGQVAHEIRYIAETCSCRQGSWKNKASQEACRDVRGKNSSEEARRAQRG